MIFMKPFEVNIFQAYSLSYQSCITHTHTHRIKKREKKEIKRNEQTLIRKGSAQDFKQDDEKKLSDVQNSKGRDDFVYTIHKKSSTEPGDGLKRRKMHTHTHTHKLNK